MLLSPALSSRLLYVLNSSLTADNGQGFQFAYDSESGKYGYMAEVGGADTFCPFKSSGDYESIPFSLAGTNNAKGADYAKVTATRDINNGLLFVSTCTHVSDTKTTLSCTSDGSPVLELLYDEGINPRTIIYKVSNLKKGEYIKVHHSYLNASTFTLCEFSEGMNFSVSDSFEIVDSGSFFYATGDKDIATGIVFAVCASSIYIGTSLNGSDNIYTTCGKTKLISSLQSEISDYKWCCDSVISTISDYKANNRIACYRPYATNGGRDPIIIVVKCT